MSAVIDQAVRQRLLAAYETILQFERDSYAVGHAVRRYTDLAEVEINEAQAGKYSAREDFSGAVA